MNLRSTARSRHPDQLQHGAALRAARGGLCCGLQGRRELEAGPAERLRPPRQLVVGFRGSELDALVTTANAGNQSFAAARATFRVARALLKQARAGYFPTVGVNPSVTRGRQPGFDASGARTGVTSTNIALPLDAAWEPISGVRSGPGRLGQAQRRSELRRSREPAPLGARRSRRELLQVRALDALKEILDSTVVAYQESLDLAQARFETGLASDQDVAQAEAQLRSTEAQASDIGIQRAQFEHALAVLDGEGAVRVHALRARASGARGRGAARLAVHPARAPP